jgi:hypothetical protein
MGAVLMRNLNLQLKNLVCTTMPRPPPQGKELFDRVRSRLVRDEEISRTTIALPNIQGISQWGCQSRNDRQPIEEFKEIVRSTKCLPRLPTLGGMDHEPLQ